MAKKVMAAILAGLSIFVAQAAFAEPVKLEGELAVKYERDTAAGDPTVSGTMNTLKLKGEADLGAGWSLYGRLGAGTPPVACRRFQSRRLSGRLQRDSRYRPVRPDLQGDRQQAKKRQTGGDLKLYLLTAEEELTVPGDLPGICFCLIPKTLVNKRGGAYVTAVSGSDRDDFPAVLAFYVRVCELFGCPGESYA